MNLRLLSHAKALIWTLALSASLSSSLSGNGLVNDWDLSELVDSKGVRPQNSALLIVRLEDTADWRSGGSRIETRFPPASTSKIPHTLIALEEGCAHGPDSIFYWDGQERLFDLWNQDQTLASAFKHSVLWVYQQITRSLGYELMSDWIARLEYGNGTIGSAEDLATYWVEGPLATSSRDQVLFLSRLVKEELPLSEQTYRQARQVMLEAEGENWQLYAKTGFTGTIGWYVGWLETIENNKSQTYVFAFNMDCSWARLASRKAVVQAALTKLTALSLEPIQI